MKKVAFCTLGCKVNQYDTQAMAEILEGAGYRTVPFSEKADVYIINTCTVTNIADRKSRQMISRARAANPGAVICVCGCLSQSSPEEILAIEGVTCVAGTAKRSDILKVIESAGNHVGAADREFEDLSVSRSGVRTRANIKIQEGCDNYCSYCIIPFVRGHERSRALDSIMDEARRLADNGVSEIVLGGIHVSSYMSADGSDLADTVGMLNSIDGIRRIRLGSLEQPALKEDFIKRLAECDKLCPHFHISLQSGSDSVLRRMNRKYSTDEYACTVDLLRKYYYDPAVTTDIIVGFPGETDRDFGETMDFAEKIGFSRIHVFPFSERKGTKAADMTGKIARSIKKERASALIGLGKKMETAYMERWVGRFAEVLFEQYEDDGLATGYTERYIKVRGNGVPGEIKKVLLKKLSYDIILTD